MLSISMHYSTLYYYNTTVDTIIEIQVILKIKILVTTAVQRMEGVAANRTLLSMLKCFNN